MIFILILIPFVMVIVLSWKKVQELELYVADPNEQTSQPNIISPHEGIFNRIVLPSLLIVVGVFSIMLVLNAYEAMDLMEQFGTAAPTMLNVRP